MAEDKATATPAASKNDIVVVGAAGFNFNIRGEGFGAAKGVLTIGTFPALISIWTDTLIKGLLPVGCKGEVVLITATGTIRKGTFPVPAPPLKIVPPETAYADADMQKQFEAFMRRMTAPVVQQPAVK